MTDDRPKPWLPATTSDCPVDVKTQEWVESSIRWFMGQFGTAVVYRDPVLPTAGFLSDAGYSATAEQIEELVAHLCELMEVDPGSFTLELYELRPQAPLLTVYFGFGIFTTNAAMRFARADRGFTIISRGLLDDRSLNAARHNDGYHRLGYLSSMEFGYALACYCWVRGETEPPGWARYVNPGPRVHMEQGLAYLARTTRRPARPDAQA